MNSNFVTPALFTVLLTLSLPSGAVTPQYRVTDRGVVIEGVSPENPMIYDNDWWKDVPDAAYLWAKATLGHADLRGNIVSRDMWGWEKGTPIGWSRG